MSRGVRLVYVRGAQVAPHVESLRRLEASVHYPLADGADHFFIDHGSAYHPFFSGMGEASFLLALRGEEVVGSIAGVVKPVQLDGRVRRALYLCDLKVAAHERGRGLARRMLLHGLTLLVRRPELRRCSLIYGAAMRGGRGDVMRSAQGLHPFRIGGVLARLALYFAAPGRLTPLAGSNGPSLPRGPGLLLGTPKAEEHEAPGLCSTAGSKDLRRVSSGQPWPLVHLPLEPTRWQEGLGAYLAACGEALVAQGGSAEACFGLDERLTEHLAWLAQEGLEPGAWCTVYALSLLPLRPAPAWVHLPTSEI
jgi:hypothetical protein